MGNGKPTKCPICRERLSSGKALGGHMSKHNRAKAKRAATMAAKPKPAAGTPEGRAMLKEIQLRLAPRHDVALVASARKPAGNVTIDMGDAAPRVCVDLRTAAKRKREEAGKMQAQVKERLDEANELDRLADRIAHIL